MDNDFLKNQTPSAMFIEMARDSVPNDKRNQDKLKELYEACGETPQPYQNGFLLGYKTADIMLQMQYCGENVKEKEKG